MFQTKRRPNIVSSCPSYPYMSGITLAGVYKGAPAPTMYNTAPSPALHPNTTNGLHLVSNGAGNGGPSSIPTNLGILVFKISCKRVQKKEFC